MNFRNTLLLIVSFLEGGVLLATEVISAKQIAPFYGNTINTWAFMLAITLLGLASGYLLGAKLTDMKNRVVILLIILGLAIVINAFNSFFATYYLHYLVNSPFIIGLFVSVFVVVFPLMLLYGTVSPLIISILKSQTPSQNWIGVVFSISTVGGVIFCIVYGLFLIPFVGIKENWMVNSVVLFIGLILLTLANKKLLSS